MLELLENIVFFPKSLDDLDGLFLPNKKYHVYACRASSEVYEKYPFAYVYEAVTGKRFFSTTKFFRKILSTLDLSQVIEKSKGVMAYQAYPWCDDLRNLGYNVCTINCLLHSALHNKFKQRDLLTNTADKSANKYLENHFKNRAKDFNTEVTFYDPKKYSHHSGSNPKGFVVSNSSSDGGSNVFRVLNKDIFNKISTYLSSPVIRIEKYIHDALPINQVGIVLSNGWIMKFQPSVQLISINEETGQFEYVGSMYNLKDYDSHLNDKSILEATKLTHFVGKSLYTLGYRGIFGCDYLSKRDSVYFTELNPRYQASTRILSMAASKERKLSPHMLHICAYQQPEDIDLKTLEPFKAAEAIITIIENNDAQGYVRVWNSQEKCDRLMVGHTLVESTAHRGYNLLY
ncbi:hypothetical protein [Desulfovibrio sp. JC022]|uniref:hypothetical protein n=1 Tax=Desulfovibrio sp. JC022 TaxID=2593642 RepID=UPI0013D12CC5|nr:hypothetical protein [Desulfovibrio sp. JC022]NDV22941.1 hypothetical protein [Desulfovibrio sp. JC022]